ncbi:FMN-binding protein [Piscinibacter sp.]|uniref:FMN-binding protein n=1 Tax=Piscinibacter sp. TaxID=1903157 RepID=UPI00355AA114
MRIALAAAAAALAPTSAFAVDYLSAEQAAKLMFPDADRFESRELTLDAVQLQELDAQGVAARSARWNVRVALHAGATLGLVVVDDVLGKFELITYAVGIGNDGAIKQVEVLSYRESHGQEIRLPAWRRQFVGKTTSSALRIGDDIANISGATLSCSHVTDGVRRIVAVVGLARRHGALP